MSTAADVPVMPYSFDSQARQFPPSGPAGLGHERHEAPVSGAVIECLLWRSRKGTLVGILYHYPDGVPGWEHPGAVNLLVHPRRRGRGIATRLVVEAMRRWEIDPDRQHYTPDGARFVDRLRERGLIE